MAVETVYPAHPDLTGGGETGLHSHSIPDAAIEFVIGGGEEVITTGQKGHFRIPFDCTIQKAALLADQSGDIVIDIWKDTYANFPPNDADSITASTPLTLDSTQKSEDSMLTGWTKGITAGDILAFNVDSATAVQRVTVYLKIRRVYGVPDAAIEFIINGGGDAITTGQKGYFRVPFNCTILRATLLSDQSGSIVVDIWKNTYANFPPTDEDSITASASPTLSSTQKSEDDTLVGWTTDIMASDILAFNVDSIETVERVTLSLKIQRT